jgi:hypothetical protein
VYARYRTVSALTRTIQVPPRPYDDLMSSFPFNVNVCTTERPNLEHKFTLRAWDNRRW